MRRSRGEENKSENEREKKKEKRKEGKYRVAVGWEGLEKRERVGGDERRDVLT